MKKGVVVQIEKTHIIMLTKDGDFVNACKPDIPVLIGEEVEAKIIHKTSRANGRITHWPSYAAIAAILMLSFVLLTPFFEKETYAYLAVDINPSFQLEIGPNGNVIDLIGINEDASKVSSKLDWQNKTIEDTINEIIKISNELGYLDERNQAILVSSIFTKEADGTYKDSINHAINSGIEEAENKYSLSSIIKQDGTMKDYNTAKNEGISFGRYIQQQKDNNKDQEDKEIKTEDSEDKDLNIKEAEEAPLEQDVESFSDTSKQDKQEPTQEPTPESTPEPAEEENDQPEDETGNKRENGPSSAKQNKERKPEKKEDDDPGKNEVSPQKDKKPENPDKKQKPNHNKNSNNSANKEKKEIKEENKNKNQDSNSRGNNNQGNNNKDDNKKNNNGKNND